jgi:hypothetical protein
VVDDEMPPEVTVIIVEPVLTEVASPLETAALLMAATFASEELQVTEAVRSWVELSV